MLAGGCGFCSSAPLPPGGTHLPEPWFRSNGGILGAYLRVGFWKSCCGGMLVLAVHRLSCACHSPVLPWPLPLGIWLRFTAPREVLCLFCRLCAWHAPGSLQPLMWEGSFGHSVMFSSFCAGARLLQVPRHLPLCSLHRSVHAGVPAQRSTV